MSSQVDHYVKSEDKTTWPPTVLISLQQTGASSDKMRLVSRSALGQMQHIKAGVTEGSRSEGVKARDKT